VYPDGLDISAKGTAAQFNRALNLSLTNYRVQSTPVNKKDHPRPTVAYGSSRDPQLPSRFAGPILAILGLTNYSAAQSQAVSPAARQSLTAASSTASLPAGSGRAPADFVKDYNLAPLEKRQALGQGRTVGIVTLVGLDPSVPFTFWNHYLKLNEPRSRLTMVAVDGGSAAPSLLADGPETDLDVEQAGAVAARRHCRRNGTVGFRVSLR
jgi:subtilase family serine protease